MVFYFLLGSTTATEKCTRKTFANEEISDQVSELIYHYSKQTFEENDAAVKDHKSLAYMLVKDTQSPLTANNEVKLLLNGENKFPEVIKALKKPNTIFIWNITFTRMMK